MAATESSEELTAALIEGRRDDSLRAFQQANDLTELETARACTIGTNGSFTLLTKGISKVSKEQRPLIGKALNDAKAKVEAAFRERLRELELLATAPKEPTDFTLPGRRRALGKLHPLTQVTDDIVRSFRKIGFVVADGPEAEDEYHCFDALNTPARSEEPSCRERV